MCAALVVILAASAVTAGSLMIALSSSHARRELQRRLNHAAGQEVKLRADLSRAQHAAEASGSTAVAEMPKTAAGTLPAAKPAAASAAAFPPRIRPPSLMDFARENPQLWNDFVQSKRAELGRLYLPLLLRLDLTPGQRERFKDILAAEIARGADIGAAADAQNLAFNDPAIAALREQSERQRQRELGELLGPAGLRAYEDFERALPVRGYVDGLATQLAATMPLTAAQADQLERALADANEAYRQGKRADPKELNWPEADQWIRGILHPDQFAIWQLGTAHNRHGGSRRDQELDRVYREAVKRMKDAQPGAAN